MQTDMKFEETNEQHGQQPWQYGLEFVKYAKNALPGLVIFDETTHHHIIFSLTCCQRAGLMANMGGTAGIH